jgi:hypothetical protein
MQALKMFSRLLGGKFEGELDHPPATKKELWGW